MLIFPTYQTLLAKTAATSSGGGSSIVDTDLYVHYDFSDTDCWNRTNGTNTDDYTIHNLANDYNDGLLRSRTDTANSYRDASDSPCIDFNSSDGGGCLESIPSNNSSNEDDCALIIPGNETSANGSVNYYVITTVSSTDTNNLLNGIGTGAFTIEVWQKFYLDYSQDAGSQIYYLKGKDTGGSTTDHRCNVYAAGWDYQDWANQLRLYAGSSSNIHLLDEISGAPSSGAAWSDWNHVVYSRNSTSTNDTKFYVNNSLVQTTTDNKNLDYMERFYLMNLSSANKVPRRFGIFRFYRGKALTSSEVTTNWNAQKSRFGH